jgi:hypothetical protein
MGPTAFTACAAADEKLGEIPIAVAAIIGKSLMTDFLSNIGALPVTWSLEREN